MWQITHNAKKAIWLVLLAYVHSRAWGTRLALTCNAHLDRRIPCDKVTQTLSDVLFRLRCLEVLLRVGTSLCNRKWKGPKSYQCLKECSWLQEARSVSQLWIHNKIIGRTPARCSDTNQSTEGSACQALAIHVLFPTDTNTPTHAHTVSTTHTVTTMHKATH